MAPNIKFDVSGSDPDRATQAPRRSPKPGMYVAKVAEINTGFSRDDETGKPDKERPRLEIIYEVLKADKESNNKYKGGRVWEYIRVNHEPQAWKMDQFLQAVGVATKKKRKGQFNTDKLVGKKVLLVVRSGSNQEGSYRGEAGQVLPYDPETFKAAKEEAAEEPDEDLDEDDLEEFEDDEDLEDDEEDDLEDEEEDEEEDDDEEILDDEDEEEEDDEDEEEILDDEDEEEEEEPEPPKRKKSGTKKKSSSKKKSGSKKKGGTKSSSKKKSSKKKSDDDDDFPF